jgi:hypothetical protein
MTRNGTEGNRGRRLEKLEKLEKVDWEWIGRALGAEREAAWATIATVTRRDDCMRIDGVGLEECVWECV